MTHHHEHGHGHGHGHDHAHGTAPERHENPLAEGAGRGKLLLFDAYSGIAGDMTIAALVDLGVPFDVVRQAAGALPLAGYQLGLRGAHAGAIGGSKLELVVERDQPERTYDAIDRMLVSSPLESATRALARAVFRTLAEAEAEVHRVPVNDVHFHEVGAVDAIIDIVGAAACIAYLGAEVVCTPLPMSRGFVQSRHGVLPLPAPATLVCLEGVPTVDAGIDVELVTPTGAAIVKTVAQRFVRWPSFSPERVGWGCGTRSLPDRPNALRVVLGTPSDAAESDGTHVIVEANVDDMTGELAAHAIGALLAAGALDAWAIPVTMKKGRPGLTLCALGPALAGDRIAEVMLRETTTLGVRKFAATRLERPRSVRHVETRFGKIPVKVSEGPYGPAQVKPEFEACAAAAASAGVPVRVVIEEAARAFHAFSRDA